MIMPEFLQENLLKYERYFETPFELLIASGISRRQKLAVLDLWHNRRIAFLYTHFHERTWETDDILMELEICRSLLEDTSYKGLFHAMYEPDQAGMGKDI